MHPEGQLSGHLNKSIWNRYCDQFKRIILPLNTYPNFAIVIPNLNQSHFLPTALESLRCQTANFSLAVMDGGSTDKFSEVVAKYSDIISFTRSAPDKGQASAIKDGKEIIDGEIVAWLNADDYYFPGALDRVASVFQSYPDLDVVYGDAIHVTPEGFFVSYFAPVQEFDHQELITNNFICQPACFVRRTAYESAGRLDPSLHFTMDWDLWCRLSLNGAKFQYIHEILAAVRYYPGTKTLSGDINRSREIYRILKKYGAGRLRMISLFLGVCYQRLSVIKDMKFIGNLMYILLEKLRIYKWKVYKVIGKQNTGADLVYGFHRWKPIVEGHCQINIPWYHQRQWRRLRLKVEPSQGKYQISINGYNHQILTPKNGYLVAEVPKFLPANRRIEIECLDVHQWKLHEFSCDY